MIIETKFNLNDNVWFIKNNKPINVLISAIEVFKVGTNQDRIKYNGKDVINSRSWLDHTNLFEDELFDSKESLMRSAFNIKGSFCKGADCTAISGVGHSEECKKEFDVNTSRN